MKKAERVEHFTRSAYFSTGHHLAVAACLIIRLQSCCRVSHRTYDRYITVIDCMPPSAKVQGTFLAFRYARSHLVGANREFEASLFFVHGFVGYDMSKMNSED
jgi:hypothetical protein